MDDLHQEIYRKAKYFQMKRKHYSFVSGACYKKTKLATYSRMMYEYNISSESLKLKLLKFGKIGERFEKSSIGCCAEVHAVNDITLIRRQEDISKISVGVAIRPRTMQTGKKCKICKSLF